MKKTNTTKRNYFTVDFLNKKIAGTKASFNKASTGKGEAYDELMTLIARHPDFTLEVKEPAKKKATAVKRTYEGLNFELMEKYIAIQENAELLKKKYAAVKKSAEMKNAAVYPIVKRWFLKQFGSEEKPFDVKEAIKQINDAEYAAIEAEAMGAIEEDAADDAADNEKVLPFAS